MGEEAGPPQIRAWGPGLEGGIVGKPAIFVVESVAADVGVLGESVGSRSDQKYFRYGSDLGFFFFLMECFKCRF